MTDAARNQMHTKTALKERGWTEGLIRELLGVPDDTRPNPRYRSSSSRPEAGTHLAQVLIADLVPLGLCVELDARS